MKMFSRSGKNTQNQHYEFMQAQAEERYNNMDESQRVQPKVVSKQLDSKKVSKS